MIKLQNSFEKLFTLVPHEKEPLCTPALHSLKADCDITTYINELLLIKASWARERRSHERQGAEDENASAADRNTHKRKNSWRGPGLPYRSHIVTNIGCQI